MNDNNNLNNDEISNTNESPKIGEKILEQLGNESIVNNTEFKEAISPTTSIQTNTSSLNNLEEQQLQYGNAYTDHQTQKKEE